MISRLHGEIVLKRPPFLIIDVSGVGYEMQAPMSTFYRLPEVGQYVTVLTHFAVREDAQNLYAFLSEYDRSLFRELLKVSGIGAKIALAILSGMDAAVFKQCILEQDVDALVRLPGIGRKTAERLIIEMKSRFNSEFWDQLESGGKAAAPGKHDIEAVQALMSLGYKAADAKRMVRQVDSTDNVEEIIRKALQTSLS